MGEELHAVADAKDGQLGLEDVGRRQGRVGVVDAGRPAREYEAARVELRHLAQGRVVRQELAVDAALADAPRDQEAVLRAEVEDDDGLARLVAARRGARHRGRPPAILARVLGGRSLAFCRCAFVQVSRLFSDRPKLAPCYTRVKPTDSLMSAPDQAPRLEDGLTVLRAGGLIALPTDTLYALVARASDAAAVERVFTIKGRERDKALPLFVADLAEADRIAVLDDAARRLATCFWPGPLTLVAAKLPAFESPALAGGTTVALRAPDHPLVLALLAALGEPVTATSANRSGGADPVSAADVRRELGADVDLVLDAGACPVGVSSTIVDCSGREPAILRAGAIEAAAIAAALGRDQPVARR